MGFGQPRQELGQGHLLFGRHLGLGVIADQAAKKGEALRSTGGIALDRPIETALPAFPDAAEPIDQEVVGDVGPALFSAGVELVPAANLTCDLIWSVLVGRCRVVDQEEAHVLFGSELALGPEIAGPVRFGA